MALAILDNEIVEAEYKRQQIITKVLEDDIKVEHENEWWT